MTEQPMERTPYLRDGLLALASDLRQRAKGETAIQNDEEFKVRARTAEIAELDQAEEAVLAELAEMQRRLDQVRATRAESRELLADAEARAARRGREQGRMVNDAVWAEKQAAARQVPDEPSPAAEPPSPARPPVPDTSGSTGMHSLPTRVDGSAAPPPPGVLIARTLTGLRRLGDPLATGVDAPDPDDTPEETTR